MDKNLVNVDNLFRQKLGGAEEKERDGAWANMRDLLDQKMPKEPVAGFGWNRTLRYSGMVLLFATLGIGAWEMKSHYNTLGSSMSMTTGAKPQSTAVNGENGKSTNPTNVAAPSLTAATGKAANQPKYSRKTSATAPSTNNTENSVAANAPVSNNGNSVTSKTNSTTSTSTLNNTSTPGSSSQNNNQIAKSGSQHNTATHAAQKTERSTNTAATSPVASANNSMATGSLKSENGKQPGTITHRKNGAGSKTSNHILASATSTGKKLPGASGQRSSTADVNATAKSDNNNTTPIRINKLVLNQRLVRDEHSGWYFTYDTVSQEMLFEQLKSINKLVDQNEYTGNKSSERALASAGTNLPEGALKTESASTAPSLKANKEAAATEHKNDTHTGARLISNLSAAFNDIKSTSSNVQFTKGITGGINGTFFGPTSFYGFNFGVTGSFNFGDNFTVKTELKYFHRINGNYQLNDDYYAYEPNSGGGYRKSKIDYDFSFSTLHSIELPVSFKYNVANFSCFAGANFLYTFGINTSAAPLQDPNAPVQIVNTKGNDDQATLNYKDFGQRFGIGYLFGIAFRLDSRSEIDLRTVQTVWDNVKTDGAKSVSNTLYKSPSIQASFNYRLGSAGKDKRGN